MGCRDDAADEDALDEAEEKEDRSREPSDLADRRQETEDRGRYADADHRHHEGATAAEAVRIGAEQGRAEGPDQQRDREGRIGAGQRQHRLVRREEQRANDRRDVKQDEQVEEIEPPAEQRGHGGGHRLPACGFGEGGGIGCEGGGGLHRFPPGDAVVAAGGRFGLWVWAGAIRACVVVSRLGGIEAVR
ncbi:hypothetical protein ABIC24_005121 [Methylobacterium radiotolerans]